MVQLELIDFVLSVGFILSDRGHFILQLIGEELVKTVGCVHAQATLAAEDAGANSARGNRESARLLPGRPSLR